MEMFTVRAKSKEECLKKMREIYGDYAVKLGEGNIRVGGFLGIGARTEYEIRGYQPDPIPSYYLPQAKNTPPQNAAPAKQVDLDAARQQVLNAAAARTGTDPKMQEILNVVKGIQDKLDEKDKTAAVTEHENLARIAALLEENDFLPAYRKKILEQAKKELTIETLDDFYELQQRVLEWIGERVTIHHDEKYYQMPRVIILVGPTGVGKTTTIAKLAAGFMMGLIDGKMRKTSLVTIDRYRLGATEQLELYAKALTTDSWTVPFQSAGDEVELEKCLRFQSEAVDIILIDTIGKSPREAVEIAGMKEMLDVCGRKAEIFLTLTAVTRAADILEIIQQFEPFAYKSVIVTKLDETSGIGNVLSALAEKGKSMVYVTDGQESTPRTLKKADVVRLLLNLKGFDVDKSRLEKRFPAADESR